MHRFLKAFLVLITLTLSFGCASDEAKSEFPEDLCTIELSPGDDNQTTIQTALIEIEENGTLCLGSGTYSFASELSLDVDGVSIIGAGYDEEGQAKTVLNFKDQTVGSNGILITSNNTKVQDFAVIDPAGDGIRASGVKGITFLRVTVIWNSDSDPENGGYGLYPVQAENVLVQDCEVVGASDAGIYVGQSTNALVVGNNVHGNVAGIEIENTTTAEVRDNRTWDNAGGILVFNLPDLPIMDGKYAKVHKNTIENNNRPNFAQEGNMVAMVPSGTGILVLAADHNEIHDNIITGNSSLGVAVIDYTEFIFGGWKDENFDPHAEGNYVHHNTFENNGFEAKGIVDLNVFPKPFPPLVWDGCANAEDHKTNCFFENGGAEYANVNICDQFKTDYDEEAVTCEYDALPGVTLD